MKRAAALALVLCACGDDPAAPSAPSPAVPASPVRGTVQRAQRPVDQRSALLREGDLGGWMPSPGDCAFVERFADPAQRNAMEDTIRGAPTADRARWVRTAIRLRDPAAATFAATSSLFRAEWLDPWERRRVADLIVAAARSGAEPHGVPVRVEMAFPEITALEHSGLRWKRPSGPDDSPCVGPGPWQSLDPEPWSAGAEAALLAWDLLDWHGLASWATRIPGCRTRAVAEAAVARLPAAGAPAELRAGDERRGDALAFLETVAGDSLRARLRSWLAADPDSPAGSLLANLADRPSAEALVAWAARRVKTNAADVPWPALSEIDHPAIRAFLVAQRDGGGVSSPAVREALEAVARIDGLPQTGRWNWPALRPERERVRDLVLAKCPVDAFVLALELQPDRRVPGEAAVDDPRVRAHLEGLRARRDLCLYAPVTIDLALHGGDETARTETVAALRAGYPDWLDAFREARATTSPRGRPSRSSSCETAPRRSASSRGVTSPGGTATNSGGNGWTPRPPQPGGRGIAGGSSGAGSRASTSRPRADAAEGTIRADERPPPDAAPRVLRRRVRRRRDCAATGAAIGPDVVRSRDGATCAEARRRSARH